MKKWIFRILLLAMVMVAAFKIMATVVAMTRPVRIVKTGLDWRVVEKRTVELLKSEAMAFLVTDRLVTSVLVEAREDNLILGRREGYLIARVKLFYGVDIASMTASAIKRRGNKLVIALPPPRLLDFSVDFDKSRYVSKRSGLAAIADSITDKNMLAGLYQKLQSEALLDLANDGQLLPTREAIVRRLNAYNRLLSSYLGVAVEFV